MLVTGIPSYIEGMMILEFEHFPVPQTEYVPSFFNVNFKLMEVMENAVLAPVFPLTVVPSTPDTETSTLTSPPTLGRSFRIILTDFSAPMASGRA